MLFIATYLACYLFMSAFTKCSYCIFFAFVKSRPKPILGLSSFYCSTDEFYESLIFSISYSYNVGSTFVGAARDKPGTLFIF